MLLAYSAFAQEPEPASAFVPEEFKDLYGELSERLNSFEAALSQRQKNQNNPVLFSTELLGANAHRGPKLLKPGQHEGILMQLDRFQSLGIQAVTVALSFPILYPPFHKNNEEYTAYLDL